MTIDDSTTIIIETAICSEPKAIVFSTDYALLGTREAFKRSLISLCEHNVIESPDNSIDAFRGMEREL